MDFDQMLDAWRAQDDKPLYGVNRDLLQLVLRNEQADIRRTLRRDQWIAYVVGTGMALFAGFWLWVLIYKRGPALQTVAAGVAAGVLALWVAAFWLSRRRQARRERNFGNTLQEEVRRNLSLVEYQLSNGGRLGSAFLWSAPPVLGALLIYWVLAQINTHNGLTGRDHALMIAILGGSTVCITFAGARAAARKLEPRRRRLRDLLDMLNAGE